MLEPPSQKLLHTQAKAKAQSSDEYVKQGVLAGIDLDELLAGLVDEFDNDGALAVPSGQW